MSCLFLVALIHSVIGFWSWSFLRSMSLGFWDALIHENLDSLFGDHLIDWEGDWLIFLQIFCWPAIDYGHWALAVVDSTITSDGAIVLFDSHLIQCRSSIPTFFNIFGKYCKGILCVLIIQSGYMQICLSSRGRPILSIVVCRSALWPLCMLRGS